jgi:hypothetical protein
VSRARGARAHRHEQGAYSRARASVLSTPKGATPQGLPGSAAVECGGENWEEVD